MAAGNSNSLLHAAGLLVDFKSSGDVGLAQDDQAPNAGRQAENATEGAEINHSDNRGSKRKWTHLDSNHLNSASDQKVGLLRQRHTELLELRY